MAAADAGGKEFSLTSRSDSYLAATAINSNIATVGGAPPAAPEPISAPICAPYDLANTWSRWTFGYVRPLLRIGWRRPLQAGDLPPVGTRDKPENVARALAVEWQRAWQRCNGKTGKWTLWGAILRAQRWAVFFSGLYAFLEAATFVLQPVVLRFFLNWLTSPTIPVDYGVGWGLAAAMIVTSLLQALTHHLLYFQTMRLGWNLRIGFIGRC